MTVGDQMASDIAAVLAAGWAVEFRANASGGPKVAVTCLFRQFGTVDVHSISRSSDTPTNAFNSAKIAWTSFLKWQSAA